MIANTKQNWLEYPADSNEFCSGYRDVFAGSKARSKPAGSKSCNQMENLPYLKKKLPDVVWIFRV